MDEYDELLAKARGMATAVPVMPETAPKLEPADEFDQLLAKARQPDLSKSQAAVFNGSFSNPAAAAEKINLSANIKKMLGEDIPPSIIDPAEDKRRIRQAEMDHALRNSAGLQKWIDRDPENAGLLDGKGAKDLAFIDTVLNYGKRGVGTLLAGAFADPAAATYTNLALPFKLGEQALTMAGLPEWAAQSEIAKALMWAARESKKTGDMLAGPPGEGNLEAGVFSGIRSLGGNLTTMFGGKLLDFGAKATTAAMSSVQGGQSALKALDEGKSASTATLFGLADTAAEYATELPGMKALLSTPGLKQGMMAFIKKAGEFGIKEMGGEQVATAWQDFNEWALLNPDKPFQEYLDARPDAAIQTAIATIVGGGGQIALQQAMVRGRQQEQKAIFDALHAGAENSELLKNVPDKYREFVKNATEDGGIKDVFIPADKFVTYFQGRDLDPAMVAQDLGITNFTEAVEAGSDVMVPMDSFATMIAGSEHYDGLSQDLRLHQGDMTAREAQLEEANREESDKALEQSIQQLLAEGEKAKGLNAAIDTIVTDIEGQLIGAGVDRSAAKTQAQLLRGVAVMAQRAFPNEDPVQAAERIWDKYNLKVTRDMPAVLKHLKDTDLEIDPLLDALRGKGPQQDSVIFGESLLEFLRGKGGLQPVGELTDAASYPTPPGQKKLISELGKKLDEAAMAAVEAGYFPGTQDGNLTETELVEAILNELGGSPTYSMNNTDEAAMGKKAAMEMLDKAIKDAGIDLNAVTDNAEVRRLLELAGPVTGAMFDQPKAGAGKTEFKAVDTESPEFKAWFSPSPTQLLDGLPVSVISALERNTNALSDFLESQSGLPKSDRFQVIPSTVFDHVAGVVDNPKILDAVVRSLPVDVMNFLAGKQGSAKNVLHDAAMLKNVFSANPASDVSLGVDPSGITELTVRLVANAGAKISGVTSGALDRNAAMLADANDPILGAHVRKSSSGDLSIIAGFGDSKVVDADGKPLVVYHGTVDDFPLFSIDFFGQTDQGEYGEGFYFTPDPDYASEYAYDAGNVMPVYLRLENPFRAPFGGYGNKLDTAAIKAAGHDGVIVEDEDGNVKEIVAFYPDQIKSAISNTGAFSATNPNILYQPAYHGSPYKFDRFTLDHIGKGEGAQAYGWGLYFAGKKEVAEFYREGLQSYTRTYKIDGDVVDLDTQPYEMQIALRAVTQPKEYGRAVQNLRDNGDVSEAVLAKIEEQIAALKGRAEYSETGSGQLYEVDIPDDGEYLLWDKPLSEQPEKVNAAIEKIKGTPAWADLVEKQLGGPVMDQADGRDLYKALERRNKSDEAASKYLNSIGIAGIKYLDGTSRDKGEGSYNYVIFDENAIKVLRTFYQGEQEYNRGYIQIGPDRQMRIGLTESANLSTFAHETGHFYLEMLGDLAETEGVSQEVKDDYARILKFLGVTTRAEIGTEQHEKWARANEAYLREGKSPAPELQGVFQRFKAWLKQIYSSIDKLNVTLSNEVRDVFDRIYASDQEIAAARDQVDIAPLFLDAEAAGMTEAEFKNYAREVGQVSDEAKDKLLAKLMKEYQRGKEQWWKDELAKVSKEVAAEIDAMPVYQAFAALTSGKLPDGTPIKLSRDELADRFTPDFIQKLPRGLQRIYAANGGMAVDTAAEILGYASGNDLIKAISEMRPRKELIEAEAKQRMADLHGDMLLDGSIENEAQVAMHNDKRADMLMIELRALRRRQRDVKPFVQAEKNKAKEARSATLHALDTLPSTAAFRAAAAGRIDQTAVRDLNPGQYLIAGQKAAREAAQALARQDPAAAVVAKQRELLNHYLYLEATKAKEQSKRIAEYAKGFDKASRRQALAKAGKGYLEQIDALLEQFEFKNVSLRTIDRRKSLADFIAEKEAEGETFAIPQHLIDDSKVQNWRQASMMELRGLEDALRNLAHLAAYKNKLLRKKAALDFDKIKVELLDSLNGSFKDSTGELSKLNDKSDTVGEKAARLWRKFDAAHIKIEQLVEWMDGGKSNGPWARYFFDLADDAQTREYDFHAAVTAQLQALSDAQSKEWRGSMMDKTAVTLPGIKGPLTRYDLISIALNTGNASNLQRLKDGRGWSDAHIKMVLDELSAGDIAFINGIWNTLESLWPEISALQERVAGVAPPKVAHQAMTVKNGELAGGYFPLVYDPKVSAVGAKQADATASVQDFMARGYGKANTSTGHTKERVENFVAPLMLDFEHVLTSHLSKVIKDISHREAIMGLSKILQNSEIKSAIIDKLGEDHYKLLTTWEQTLISDRADTLHSPLELHNAIFRGLRTHTAIVTMGWKISTMLSQFAGFGPSMDLVKGKYLTAAMIQARLHPKATLEFVQQKSGEMRHRANTIDRDMKDVLLKTRGEHGIMVAVQRSAFFLTGMADRTVSIPTWLGAYNQALAEGMSEEDATRSGDRAVRLSQGSGGAKDLAAVQRNSELMKLLTMYYTPFSVLYARLRDMGHTTKGMRDLPHAAARALVLVILPAVLGELLVGRGPDDDEDKVMWAARKALLYPFATMPVIRDLVNWQIDPALTKLSGGALHFQPGYKLSPVVQAIEKIGGLPGKVIDGMTGDRQWDDVAWDALEASGYMFGLPTAQPRITAEYLTDLWTGSASPEDAGQALHDILFRRPLERNPK